MVKKFKSVENTGHINSGDGQSDLLVAAGDQEGPEQGSVLLR
jgi:hypothetical protein